MPQRPREKRGLPDSSIGRGEGVAQAAQELGTGDHRVGQVEHHDARGADGQPRFGRGEAEQQEGCGQGADDQGGRRRLAGAGGDPGEAGREGQGAVAGHREEHPGGGGLDGEGGHRDREGHVAEQRPSEAVAEPAGEDVATGPSVPSRPSVRLGAASRAASTSSEASTPAAVSAVRIVRGATRRGCAGLLAHLARAVEADHHVRGGERADEQRGPAAARVHGDRRRAVGVGEQQDDDQHGADDLGGDADPVDQRHHPVVQQVDERW